MGKLVQDLIFGGSEEHSPRPRKVQAAPGGEVQAPPRQPERKAEMIRRGDVFIAFPGGTGTLEEISEIMSLAALKLTKAPCILYNLNGYYDHLRLQLRHMVDMGLSASERLENIHFAASLQEIKDIAASAE